MKKTKILVTEDEDIVRHHICNMLKNLGYKVVEATTDKDAIKKIIKTKPNIVLIETMLYGEPTGIDAADLIYKKYNIPVVYITAYSDDKMLRKAIKTEPFGYILKPFEERELQTTIEMALYKFNTEMMRNKRISRLEKHLKWLEDKDAIVRELEFPPKYRQAAMSILSYFGEIVRQKYPEISVGIKIEQENSVIRMIIKTPDGKEEEIEQTLENYGLIVLGKLSPEDFLKDPIHVFELKQQLTLLKYQLEIKEELYKLIKSQYGERLKSLEEEVQWLRSHVGNLLLQSGKDSENLKTIYLEVLQNLSYSNYEIKDALGTLIQKIESGIEASDEKEIKSTLKTIKRQNAVAFKKVINIIKKLIIEGSIAGASGNLLYEWIKSLF